MTFAELESEWQRHGLPPVEELLLPVEAAELALIRAHSRRQTWLSGRKMLRLLLLENLQLPPDEVEIRSRDGNQRGIRPEVSQKGSTISGCFSLTHTENRIAAAGTNAANNWIGIDLVTPAEIKPDQFTWALTDSERAWAKREENQSHLHCVTLWALKEATYKAANREGEGFNPQQIEIRQDERARWSATYRGRDLAGVGEWSVERVGEDLLACARLRS